MKQSTVVGKSFVVVACLMTGCAMATLPDDAPVATPQMTDTPLVATRATATTVVSVPVASEPDPLDGTRWELVAFVGQEVMRCPP